MNLERVPTSWEWIATSWEMKLEHLQEARRKGKATELPRTLGSGEPIYYVPDGKNFYLYSYIHESPTEMGQCIYYMPDQPETKNALVKARTITVIKNLGPRKKYASVLTPEI